MKTYTLLFTASLMALSVAAQAQWKKVSGNGKVIKSERSVSSFQAVQVGGSMQVIITPGAQKVVVEADDNVMEYIITEVKDGELRIRQKDNVSISSRNLKVYVSANALNAARVSGSGSIDSEQRLPSNGNFTASIAGSGSIRFRTTASEVKSSISGSGSIDLGGESQSLNVSIAGSGSFKGYDLRTKGAAISISGSGDVETQVNGNLDARISGSGNVYYKGDASVSLRTAGSGKVKKMD